MARLAPLFISMAIIIVSSLVVTTLLDRTPVSDYVVFINTFVAVTLGPAVYTRLKRAVELNERPHPNPYTFNE